ncbi:hypothetical protein [Corynebacterium amycolatum]|uniref:hypothetical protein n=1 Tax=Corynebacterium amycolatum TaxID=43765 RepID=UPI0021D3AD5F|nr:hypothetical protein [Corynebacterium amycolatum]
MSKHRLKITLTDQPEPDAAVSTRKVSIRSSMARKLFGPQQLTRSRAGQPGPFSRNYPPRRRPHGLGSRRRCYPER